MLNENGKISANNDSAETKKKSITEKDIGPARIVNRRIKYRIVKDKLFKFSVILIASLATVPLLFIMYYIVKMGVSSISWEFFFELPKPPGELGGGVSNAIVGTLILIALSSLMAIPPAIGLGIYLSENSEKNLAGYISTGVEVLQGVPSIVIGIIAYVWVVIPMGGFSTFSGAVALGMMMIPFIAKSTEETLKLIPMSIKEASMALGVPYYKTVLKVIIPAGLSGIITGVLIAVARVAGETAPLLFTAFGNHYMSLDISEPINALPLLIFNYAGSPYQEWHALAWGASLVLVVMVLMLNIVSKVVSRKWRIKF